MIIVKDTREQQGWSFVGLEIVSRKLDEGDYTALELLEHEEQTGEKTVRIERKASTSEIANNLTSKFATFEKELNRLFDYERKVIICEFPVEYIYQFPENSGIPKNKLFKKNSKGQIVKNVKITPKMLLDKLEYIQNIYDVEIIYCNSKLEAEEQAKEILSDAIEKKIKR